MPPVLLANRAEVAPGAAVPLGARLTVEDVPAMPGWYYAAVGPADDAAPAEWAHKWRSDGRGRAVALGLWPRPPLRCAPGALLFRMVHVLHSDAGDVSEGMKRRQPFTWAKLRAGCVTPWRVLAEVRFEATAEVAAAAAPTGVGAGGTLLQPRRRGTHAAQVHCRQASTEKPSTPLPSPPPPPPSPVSQC